MTKDYQERLQKVMSGDPEGKEAFRDPAFVAAFQADIWRAMRLAKARYQKEKRQKEAAARREARKGLREDAQGGLATGPNGIGTALSANSTNNGEAKMPVRPGDRYSRNVPRK